MLRKLRSEKTAEIKQLKLQLDHLKTHKVAAASTGCSAGSGCSWTLQAGNGLTPLIAISTGYSHTSAD